MSSHMQNIDQAYKDFLNKRLKDMYNDSSPLAQEYKEVIEKYLKLYGKFTKVLTISDKYQETLTKLKISATGKKMQKNYSIHQTKESDDELLSSLENDLNDKVKEIVSKYRKLQKQQKKILSISDAYQKELRENGLKLEILAKTDELTGLSNRRDMMERMEMESARSQRNASPISVIMFDIDDFKKINDTYGHNQGDVVLINVASILQNKLRRSDICARWGGEEFLILCPDSFTSQALTVAEKCRQAVEAMVIDDKGVKITVTISGGVAASQAENNLLEWENLVRAADKALYESKAKGKNQITVA